MEIKHNRSKKILKREAPEAKAFRLSKGEYYAFATEEEADRWMADLKFAQAKARGQLVGKLLHESAKGRAPTNTITVRRGDYEVLKGFAGLRGVSLAEAIHLIAESLKRNHPEL